MRLPLLVALLAVPAIAGCVAQEAPVGRAPEVRMDDEWRFTPPEIEVAPGTDVRWLNDGAVPHTVTFDDAVELDVSGGETANRTFSTPGTYGYRCRFHPGMEGTVHVEARR